MLDFVKKSGRLFLFLILPTVVVCLIILEIGLRVTGRFPSNTTDGFFVQYGNSYRLKKDFTKKINLPSYQCTIHTNSFGFRDRTSGSTDIRRAPYFAFIGESLTFANGVDYELSFPGIVGQLAEKQGLGVLNLAVGGHLFSDQEDLFHDFMAIAPRRPSQVILCFSPPFVIGFDERYSDILVKKGYLFRRNRWFLSYIRIILGNSSSAYCFFRDNIRKIQGALSHSNVRAARRFLDMYSKSGRFAEQATAVQLEQRLTELDQYIAGLGATPVYVYLPLSTDFRINEFMDLAGESPAHYDLFLYYDLLRSHCEKSHIELINLYPILKKHAEEGTKLSFLQDAHYNATAHRIIGEAVYQGLSDNGILSPSVKQ